MKRRLIIIGAGDFAREVLWVASEVPAEHRDWEVGGFLDDKAEEASARMARYGINLPVIGTIAAYQPLPGDCFTNAIGSTSRKLALCEQIRRRGGEFVNVIHPSAVIGPRAELGTGIFIGPRSVLMVDVRLGNDVTLIAASVIGHNAVVEDGSTICANCTINGHGHLERGVYMGANASVLPSARVGEGATVGAGSVVLKKVPPGTTVFGVPAKRL